MNIKVLSDQVSVSGQLSVQDVDAIAAQNIDVLVCNRPDNEELNQPEYQSIAQEFEKLGIETVFLPFNPLNPMTEYHVQEFAALMQSDKRIHAYCRTGARCTSLFETSKQWIQAQQHSS